MKISLHGQGIELSQAICLHTNRCFATALDRYERRVGGLA